MCYNCMTLKTIAKEIYFIRRILRLQYFPLTNGQDTWNGILNIDCRDIQANHLKIASRQQPNKATSSNI